MKKVCIFDLDGTLVDTLDSLLYSMNGTLAELSLPPISRSQCREFIGNGARYLVKQSILSGGAHGTGEVAIECNEDLVDRAMKIYMSIFAENCTYQVVAYDGIMEMLASLKEQGFKLAILTNKPHNGAIEIAEQYFGTGYFDFIQGQQDNLPRKPDPEIMYYVLKQLDAKREDCIYIGDSEVDLITGENANVATIGVSWGFRDREFLEEIESADIVDSAEELLACILRMN